MAVSTMVTPPGVKLRSDGRPMPLRQETLKKTLEPVPTMDRDERSSFASFKEDRGAVAQSFLDSPISSYALQCDNAIDDDSEFDTSNTNSGAASPISATSSNPVDELVAQQKAKEKAEMGTKVLATPLTNPATNLHAFVCPADGFRGWKEIPVHGRLASRSFSDLRIFNNQGFTWEPKPIRPAPKRTASRFAPGDAPFEKMPVEILSKFIQHLPTDTDFNITQTKSSTIW